MTRKLAEAGLAASAVTHPPNILSSPFTDQAILKMLFTVEST